MRFAAFPILALLALWAPRALAQPDQVDRTLKTIDFEERRLGNTEDLPMHFTKLQSALMPHYVTGRLSTDRARSGKYSFRFDLDGGSCVYRYDPGQVKVHPGSHYHVSVYVQTTALQHARARLSAAFYDQDARQIEPTLRHSELYAADRDDAPWRLLDIELTADDKADSLVVELELLQPVLYQATTLGKQALFPQDIHGSAWFDDLCVSQVPRVTMSTSRAGNIFPAGQAPLLMIHVNDRYIDDLAARLVVRDAAGRIVHQRTGALGTADAGARGDGESRVTVPLPALPAGWYNAALEMTSRGQPLGDQSVDIIVLADDGAPVRPDERFGVIATGFPIDAWSRLPQILPHLGVGRVKLAVWSRQGDIQQLDASAFDQLLVQLQSLRITPTACLLELPPEVAQRVGGSDWSKLLTAQPQDWQPQLALLLARHANHLDRWQLGPDNTDAFVTKPEMREVYNKVYAEFSRLVQSPDLAMPWPAWYELDGQLPATVALSTPPSVLPEQLPLYMQDIRRQPGHNLSLSLQLLDEGTYGRDLQIRDLAQRVVYALAADASRIDLPLPFGVQRAGDGSIDQPQELFLIIRTLIRTLSGAAYRGKVPLGEGVEAFLFERDGQGIVALWDRGSGKPRTLPLCLGDNPARVDLWGNVTPLRKIVNGKAGNVVEVPVGAMPTFLVDIDAPLALLRASVAIDQPLIESSFAPHARKIRFTNTYKQAISGQLKLEAPQGWTLSPPVFTFNLNPGETFEKDFGVEFPFSSNAGRKSIIAHFTLQADRTSSLDVPLTIKLGLSDVGMQAFAVRDGKDVLVQQIITNYGEKKISYTAFAIVPNEARQERLVIDLAAGKTIIKRYRFPASSIPKDAGVRVGLKQMDGDRILNDTAAVQ